MNPNYVTPEVGFLHSVEFSLRWLRWSKTDAAKHGRNVPQPIPLIPEPNPADDYVVMTPDEMDAFLGRSFRN